MIKLRSASSIGSNEQTVKSYSNDQKDQTNSSSVEDSRNLRNPRSKSSLGLQGKYANNKDQKDHTNSSPVVFSMKLIGKQRSMSSIGLQEHDDVKTNNEDQKDSRFKIQKHSSPVVSTINLTRKSRSILFAKVQVHNITTQRKVPEDQIIDSCSRDYSRNSTVKSRSSALKTTLQIQDIEADRIDVCNEQLQEVPVRTFLELHLPKNGVTNYNIDAEDHININSSGIHSFECKTIMRNIIQQQCMKTGTFITILLATGLVVTNFMYFFPELYNASLRMLITMLGTFVGIVVLVLFDKDIIDCFQQKVFVHFSHQ